MVEVLQNILGGILEVPSFAFTIIFRLGVLSYIMQSSLLFCLVFLYLEFKDKKSEDAREGELVKEKERVQNLKRYAKS